MTNSKISAQPDWHKMAEKFDLWLPHIAPVGIEMLNVLKAKSGDKILDIASGTGEPALTLARNQPDVDITGVDAAEGMINVAKRKVEDDDLKNISFDVMPAEKLTFADNAFDHITCRFGVMLFENPLAGLKEMNRTLKIGGSFVLAVWSEKNKMPTLKWSYEAFKGKVADEDMPPLKIITSLGEPGVMEDLLTKAGFSDFTVESKKFEYKFNSFEEYWALLESSDILKRQFDVLPNAEQENVKNDIAAFAGQYVTNFGLVIPHEFLLVCGKKAG